MVWFECYTDSTMKINYILIDYENVQPADLAALDQAHFRSSISFSKRG